MEELYYKKCNLCPRECGTNRIDIPSGFCMESSRIKIASACLHFGEEPPITVFGGSGTIFVSGCNLHCGFCQNYQISQQGMGKEISSREFANICLKLQVEGAENINIVTGSHGIPALAKGITLAKEIGLSIPVCWNSSAYEKPETLKLLLGLVDIWLPDLKTLNPVLSQNVFKAKDYPERAKEAILFMLENSPMKLETVATKTGDKREKMQSGVIVRHLFLPGRMDDTIFTLEWLKNNVDVRGFVSLMTQYTPVPFKESPVASKERQKSLSALSNRLVSSDEFADLQDLLVAYNFENIFYQELEQDTSWLPDFSKVQPFPNKLAKPIWHWTE